MSPNSTYTFTWNGNWRDVWYSNVELFIDRNGRISLRPIDASSEELDPGDTSEMDNFLHGFVTI